MKLALTGIRTDGGTQPRAEISIEMVGRYQEEIEGGAEFPALVVFHDGSDYWLADGFHRYRALRAASKDKAEVEIRQGTQRDAVLYSVGANALHGLPRTNADKRRAVETLLHDDEWAAKSDRWIAEKCAVSDRLVNGMRAELGTANGSQLKRKQGKDGKIRRPPPRPPRTQAAPLDVKEVLDLERALEVPPRAVLTISHPTPEPDGWAREDEMRAVATAMRSIETLAASWPGGRSYRFLIDSLRGFADRLETKEEEKAWQASSAS